MFMHIDPALFITPVDLRSKASLINFFEEHETYHLMNSWNGISRYAHNIKMHHIGITATMWDTARAMLEEDWLSDALEDMNWELKKKTGHTCFVNGQSGGWLVYDNELQMIRDRDGYEPDDFQLADLKWWYEDLIVFDRLTADLVESFHQDVRAEIIRKETAAYVVQEEEETEVRCTAVAGFHEAVRKTDDD